jgi:chorismate mutase
MKKINGIKKGGAIKISGKIQYCDTELLQLVGKKGIKEILKAIEASRKDRANGFVGYTVEEVFEEVNKAIKEVEINGI